VGWRGRLDYIHCNCNERPSVLERDGSQCRKKQSGAQNNAHLSMETAPELEHGGRERTNQWAACRV
jgi:hypothetical protein